jgi:predicted transposase YbfD/YdcC
LATGEKWKGLRTIGMAIHIGEKDSKDTSDVRNYISSTKIGGRRFAKAVRGHWGIDNTLHWCLDVTFDRMIVGSVIAMPQTKLPG